jgi:hypothetical protein
MGEIHSNRWLSVRPNLVDAGTTEGSPGNAGAFFANVSQDAPPQRFEIPDVAAKTKTPRPSLASAFWSLAEYPARC